MSNNILLIYLNNKLLYAVFYIYVYIYTQTHRFSYRISCSSIMRTFYNKVFLIQCRYIFVPVLDGVWELRSENIKLNNHKFILGLSLWNTKMFLLLVHLSIYILKASTHTFIQNNGCQMRIPYYFMLIYVCTHRLTHIHIRTFHKTVSSNPTHPHILYTIKKIKCI